MRNFTVELNNEGASLTAYLPDLSPEMPHMNSRRAVLVIPGGGYYMCSAREAEPVAFKFLAEGFAAFILRYSLNENSVFPKPLEDAEQALGLIRENSSEWGVDPDRIAAIGFSAGGHLAAALSAQGRVRPNAQILGYPCILQSMCDKLAAPVPEVFGKADENTPPAFIFSSFEDGTVPIANSLKYAGELDEKGISCEMHVFSKGYHGFSTADAQVYDKESDRDYNSRCADWAPLCFKWLDDLFGKC